MADDWFFELNRAMKEGPAGTDSMFPTQVTPEERAVGFSRVEITSPSKYALEPGRILAVAVELGGGLRAVKTADPDGQISYAIWNQAGRPVFGQPEAFSVDELKARFDLGSGPASL